MSQNAGLGGPTPRRSTRLSSKAGSVVEQSVVTTVTSADTRRRQPPLTKVKTRQSNAYGASGRVGAAEEQAVSATGFAQAFQNQRGGAVARDDEEDVVEENDSIDELGADAMMSGALNGRDLRPSPPHQRSSPPRSPVAFGFEDTPGAAFTDDDLDLSIGDGSKSFGMDHETGMLRRPSRSSFLRSSSLQPTPVPRNTIRSVGQTPRALLNARTSAQQLAIEQSANRLQLQERARLQREGPPPPRPAPQVASRLVPSPVVRPTPRQPQVQSRLARVPEVPGPIPPQPSTQTRIQPSRPEVVKRWLGQVEPVDDIPSSEVPEDEPEWPWLSLVQNMFWGSMAIIIILLLATIMPVVFSDPSRKVGMHTAVIHRISTAWYDLADYIMPGDRQYNETKVLLTWLESDGKGESHIIWSRMWKNHREYVGKFDELEDAIEKIKEELPDLLVMRRSADEKLEITDEFWNALLSKLQAKSDDPTWTEFLRSNSQKIRDLDGTSVDVSKPTARPQIVVREELAKLMREYYDAHASDVDRRIGESLKAHETQMKSLIHAEARKTLMDSIRLQSLAQSNLVANYELNLLKPNYFSSGLGAFIDPRLTSSTFEDESGSILRKMLGRKPNPPIAALMGWDEVGDSWCAAPSPIKGHAQLGVSLPRSMVPKQMTVEHAPKSMSPAGDVRNAPRDIELWAQTDRPIKQHFDQSASNCRDPGGLKSRGYVCLGAFKYNIHATNHVQTFDLGAELAVPTNKVVVQVTSNWGAVSTCLYRLRLHGDDAEDDHKYDINLND